ncbi:hypothetical protein [Rhodococcus sp. BP22]|uniref:hypothetical protein n=1 Tax=Rhodococcus sp. BP22 TaxID=2758566 RepID=UPI0016485D30|nr:hypothetical protein [Rhodococcus sp. BP22]
MNAVARRSIAVVVGSALAVIVGVVAASLRGETVAGIVFFAAIAPISVGALWVLLPGGAPEAPEHPEDTVEHEWMLRASSGAFLDVLIAMGLAVSVASVLDVEQVPLVLFVVLSMADFAIRFWTVQRRAV